MNGSFQNDIKELLSIMNNDNTTTVKDTYDYYLGEGSYDDLLVQLNQIENNYMVKNKYDNSSLTNIGDSMTNFYEMILNDKISKDNMDVRLKDIELDDFSSKMKDIINKRVKGEEIDVQDKSRTK